MRNEWIARLTVIGLLTVAIGIPLGSWWGRSEGLVIHARMAESGGWTPEYLTAEVGKPLHLRLTSDDVVHSFAIGQSDEPPVDIFPGEISEVTLVFDQPGRYTFYCTRWCGQNHWRMRGTIEVRGEGLQVEEPQAALYAALELDIDAELQAQVTPEQKPSAERGAQLDVSIDGEYQDRMYYRTHSPVELWESLRAEDELAVMSDQEIWDLVAFTWRPHASEEELALGEQDRKSVV